ncbi:hypothetical protein [Nitrosomonas sp. Nm33]|uniref:hypothetical protein n=1 Tax=Nitrosomonas sp. Nm33 TaxID=133724 RepID=UPI000B843DF2|nr:hypothetical protein [Nitrosomonas sp. Nm33]
MKLYRTQKGKFVCERINRTRRQGERDTTEAIVCENHNQVADFFGYGWLAKELYEEVGIDASIDVDKV